jgi:iron complex outermembrane receptor protein
MALSWAPIEDLRFRGVVSTGYRAPNVLELFGGLADSYDLLNTPQRLPQEPTAVVANCQAQGVPAGYIQNARS